MILIADDVRDKIYLERQFQQESFYLFAQDWKVAELL
jgi:hypothetical protein